MPKRKDPLKNSVQEVKVGSKQWLFYYSDRLRRHVANQSTPLGVESL
jgi:hypothetical protein